MACNLNTYDENTKSLANTQQLSKWKCCHCGQGWWNMKVDVYCPNCGTPHCKSCDYTY
ncbi:hypothetical protein BGZ63DRAFT_376592 [Mariannaea sp. PMI_226]|nr:hypothetical protein BGZ63DRAFT_376592 [Mariannaea sp. PMI_226]